MKLIIFRHGIAIDRMDPHCPADADRWLTKRGIRRTNAAARGLAALEVEPDLVLSSPLVRARQTAEIAADVLGGVELEITDSLRGGISVTGIFAELASLDVDTVVIVGHAPQLDIIVEHSLPAGRPQLERMKKAGAVMIEFDEVEPGGGRLGWQMQPRALRALGAST